MVCDLRGGGLTQGVRRKVGVRERRGTRELEDRRPMDVSPEAVRVSDRVKESVLPQPYHPEQFFGEVE